jgi:two-component system chemotaxis response regulator CheY
MRTTEDTQAMERTITLPAVVDRAAANALLAALREKLAADQSCGLDASNVERLMLPGIQVILAAIKSSEKIKVVNPSALFCAAFEDAGLSWLRGEETSPSEQAEYQAQDQVPSADPARDLNAPAREQAQPGQSIAAAGDERRPPKRILTIDDSRTMRDMLRMTLANAGYVVIQAVDGLDGLDVLKKERVDVVITDINMPKLDGYGVIRRLRADSGYDDTPILVLSTENDQKTKDIGRDAGATGWLVKPFDPDQLVEIVRQVSP